MGIGLYFQKQKDLLRPGKIIAGSLSFLFENKNRPLVLGFAAGLILLFFFGHYLKDFVVLVLLATIGILSTSYKRYMRVPPAVELVTFSTVMASLAYGPVVGAIFGAVVTVLAEVFNSGIDAFIVGYIPARAIVGFTAAFFPTTSIVTLGLLMSILYNAVAQPLYALQSDAELKLKLIAFVVVNISSNFVIFAIAGGLVKGLIV